jgi:multiple RNA-binding domain-containing protein 1
MESSRIFVRNLPPSITEDKFRAHFALYPITDVRLIAKRRIGFVGFKTPDEASKAVKHYDRSFVGLSKISVQIATPVCSPSLASVELTGYRSRGSPDTRKMMLAKRASRLPRRKNR